MAKQWTPPSDAGITENNKFVPPSDAVEVKKKGVSQSTLDQDNTSSDRLSKTTTKPTASLSLKGDGTYTFPGQEGVVFEKKDNQWSRKEKDSYEFKPINKVERVNNLEKRAVSLDKYSFEEAPVAKVEQTKFQAAPKAAPKKPLTQTEKAAQTVFKQNFSALDLNSPEYLKRKAEQDKINNSIGNVDLNLVGMNEEDVVPKLKESIKDYPYLEVDESGVGYDEILVRNNITGESKKISLDNWTGQRDNEESKILRGFLDAQMNSKEYTEAYQRVNNLRSQITDATPTDRIALTEKLVDAQAKLTEEKNKRAAYVRSDKYLSAAIYDKNAQENIKTDLAVTQLRTEDYKEKVNQYNEFSTNVNDSYAQGKISKEDYYQNYAPKLKAEKETLFQEQQKLRNDYLQIKSDQQSIDEVAGDTFAIEENRGNVLTGATSAILKGVESAARFGLESISEEAGGAKEGSLQGVFQQLAPGSISNMYTNSANRSTFEQIVFGLAESGGAAMTGIATGGPAGSLMGLYASSYTNMKDQMNTEAFKGVPEWQKILMSSVYGATIGSLEEIGLSKWFTKTPAGKGLTNWILKKVITELPKDATAEAIDLAVKKSFKTAVANGLIQVTSTGLVEGSTELSQEAADMVYKDVFNKLNGKQFFDKPNTWEGVFSRLGENFKLGFLGGAGMQSITQTTQTAKNAITMNQLNNIENLIENPNIKDIYKMNLKDQILSGEITSTQAKDQLQKLDELEATVNKIPNNVKAEDKYQAFQLLNEREDIQKEIAGKDPALVAAQTERINAINEELKTISQNAVQEQTTSEVSVQPGAEVSGEMAQGESQAGPEVIAEESQKVEIGGIVRGYETISGEDSVGDVRSKIPEQNNGTVVLEGKDGGQYAVAFSRKGADGKNIFEQGSNTPRPGYISASVKIADNATPEQIQVAQQEAQRNLELIMPAVVDGSINVQAVNDIMAQQQAVEPSGKTGQLTTVETEQVATYRAEEQAELLNAIPKIESYKVNGEIDKTLMPKTVLAKYNKIYDKYDKLISPLLETTSKVAPVSILETTENELTERNVRTMSVKYKRNPIVRAATNVLKALPGVKIYLHEDTDQYSNALANKTGESKQSIQEEESAGSYIDGEIHLDMSRADLVTLLHEAVHHALLVNGIKGKYIIDMANGLRGIIKDKARLAELDKFVSQYKEETDQETLETRSDEFMAQLGGILAANQEELTTTGLTKFKALINRIFKKLGLGNVFTKASTSQDAVNFINAITRGLNVGEDITQLEPYSVGEAVSVKPNAPMKMKYQRKAEYDVDFVTNIPTKSLKDVVDKYDGKVFMIQSDATGVGYDSNGDPIYGGIGYIAIKENVDGKIGFASVDMTTAKTTISKMVNRYGPDEKIAVLVMVQNPSSTVGNYYGGKYFGRGLIELQKQNKTNYKAIAESFVNFIESKQSVVDALNKNKTHQKLIDLIKNPGKFDEVGFAQEFVKDTTFDVRREILKTLLPEKADIRTNKSTPYIKQSLKDLGFNRMAFLNEYGDNTLFTEDMYASDEGGLLAAGFEMTLPTSEGIDKFISGIENKGIKHHLFNGKLPYTDESFLLDGLYPVNENFSEFAKSQMVFNEENLDKDQLKKIVQEKFPEDKSYDDKYTRVNSKNFVKREDRTYTHLTSPNKIKFKAELQETNPQYFKEQRPDVSTDIARGMGFTAEKGAKQEALAEKARTEGFTKRKKQLTTDKNAMPGAEAALEALGETEAQREAWKKKNKVNQKQKRNPIVQQAVKDYFNEEITQKEYLDIVAKNQPIKPFKEVPDLPSLSDITNSLKSNQLAYGIIGLTKNLKDGEKVATRLDIPAYENYDTWVVSIHDGVNEGKSIAYGQTAVLKNVDFKTLPKRGIQIAMGADKTTIGRMFGEWFNEDPEVVHARAKELMNDSAWTQVGMNPFRYSWFYDKADGMPLASADEVVQVGALVLAKNVKKVSPNDPMFETKSAKGNKIRFQKKAPNGQPSNLNDKQWEQVRTPAFKKWFGDWENDPKNASKVVDENGEPKVVYHGSRGGFDEFKEEYLGGTTDTEISKMGFFFTNNENVAKTFQFISQEPNIDELREIVSSMSYDEMVEFNDAVMKTRHFRKGGEITSEDDESYEEFLKDIENDSQPSNSYDSFGYMGKVVDFLKSKGIEFNPYVGGEMYKVFLNIRNPFEINADGELLDNSESISYDESKYDGVIVRNTLDSIPMSERDGGIESDVFITKNPTAIKSATENVGTFSAETPKIKFQKAPKILGQKPTVVIVKDEAKALIDQIKLEVRAQREQKKAQTEVRKSISDSVKAMVKKGSITLKQASTVISTLNRVNLDNPEMVSRFNDYIAKVFDRAEYIDKVERATRMKKKIKANLKGSSNPFAIAAKGFSQLEPKWVENIDDYIMIAQAVYDSVRKSTARKGVINWKQEADFQIVAEYVFDEEARQTEMLLGNLRSLYERITGESSNGVAADVMQAELKDLNIPEDFSADVLDQIEEKLAEFEQMVEDTDPEVVQKAASIDPTIIPTKEAIRILDALDTYFMNGSTAGLDDLMNLYIGRENVIKFKYKGKPLRSFGSKTLAQTKFKQLTQFNMILERKFRTKEAALAYKKASGIQDIENGANKAEAQAMRKQREYMTKFGKIKGFNSAENIFQRGALANLLRTMVASEELQQAEFDRNITILRNSVDTLSKGNANDQKKAKVYKKVLTELGVFRSDVDLEMVLKNAKQENINAVNFVIDMFGEIVDPLSDLALGMYNQILTQDVNYTPYVYKMTDLKKTFGSNQDNSSMDFFGVSNYANQTFDKNKAGVLMPITRPKNLRDGMHIDLDFDNNMFRQYRNALVDLYTAGPIRQFEGFFNSEENEKILGSNEDQEIIKSAMVDYVRTKKGSNFITDDGLGFLNKISDYMAQFGAARALVGIGQFVNQFSSGMTNTIVNAGEYIRPGDFSKEMFDFMANSGRSIANVGGDEILIAMGDIDKSIERADLGNRPDQYVLKFIAKENMRLFNVMVAYPDAIARKLAWMAYYRKSMVEQGLLGFTESVDTTKLNDTAADYAQLMVDRNMDATDATLRGSLFRNRNASVKILRSIFMPFASFGINQKNRMWNDLNALASGRDIVTSSRSIASIAGELVVYNAIRYYVAKTILGAALSLLGYDDDDQEELYNKLLNNAKLSSFSKLFTDIISPLPLLDNQTLNLANKAMKGSSLFAADPEVVQKYVDKLKVKGNLTDEEIEEKKKAFEEKNARSFYVDTEANIGTLGIQYEKAIELMDLVDAWNTGEYVDDNNNERFLSKDSQEKLTAPLMMKFAATVYGTRELDQIANKSFKLVKDAESMSSTQQDNYKEIKKELGRDLTEFEMAIIKKKRTVDTAIGEIEYLESKGKFNKEQASEYLKVLDVFPTPSDEMIIDIQNGKKAADIIKRNTE